MAADKPGPLASRRAAADPGGLPAGDLARLADGRSDFIDFYDREHHRVVVFLMHNGASRQAAEDAMQEAVADAWALVEAGRWAQVASPGAWIRVVALNKYRRSWGPRGALMVLPALDLGGVTGSAEDPADLADSTLFVLQELRGLPAELRAIMAFQLDGFTGPETAGLLGITAQQVRDLRKKARKILRARLAREGRRRT
jgi:DNA-directed RNA polymerase specialized sigma24 family protein